MGYVCPEGVGGGGWKGGYKISISYVVLHANQHTFKEEVILIVLIGHLDSAGRREERRQS